MRLSCLLMLLALVGCVERRLIVKSDPPGAAIYVDGQLKGETDAESGELEVPFLYYGTRTVVARSPGHLPERRNVDLDPPWYQYFPLGLFSELLWPGTIVDEHRPEPMVLKPRPAPRPAREVESEAEAFREGQEGNW